MDLRFSDADHAFRAEARAFIDANLDAGVRRKLAEHRSLSKAEIVAWQRCLNTRRWATPSWPQEHGGPGWSAVQRYIFLDELHQAPAPEPLSFNVNMIGPVLIAFGTPEQQWRFLPRIANLDDWWAQGFSEPGAGSTSRPEDAAVRDGDDYVVNGQKIWQGMAQTPTGCSRWSGPTRRTKRQAGISFLLIDMRSPGVTVRPIITIDGRHEVNEVFLDAVRVPVSLRVGEENRGWDITKFLLGHERTGIARIGMTKRLIARAKALAAHVPGESGPRQKSRAFANAPLPSRSSSRRWRSRSCACSTRCSGGGHGPDARASIVKVKGRSCDRLRASCCCRPPGRAPGRGRRVRRRGSRRIPPSRHYFNLRAASIYGGSNEVQKNILAKTALGLSGP